MIRFKAPFVWKEVVPKKGDHLFSRVNFSEVNYFARAKTLTTALVHALVVSLRQSCPDWASQCLYLGGSIPETPFVHINALRGLRITWLRLHLQVCRLNCLQEMLTREYQEETNVYRKLLLPRALDESKANMMQCNVN